MAPKPTPNTQGAPKRPTPGRPVPTKPIKPSKPEGTSKPIKPSKPEGTSKPIRPAKADGTSKPIKPAKAEGTAKKTSPVPKSAKKDSPKVPAPVLDDETEKLIRAVTSANRVYTDIIVKAGASASNAMIESLAVRKAVAAYCAVTGDTPDTCGFKPTLLTTSPVPERSSPLIPSSTAEVPKVKKPTPAENFYRKFLKTAGVLGLDTEIDPSVLLLAVHQACYEHGHENHQAFDSRLVGHLVPGISLQSADCTVERKKILAGLREHKTDAYRLLQMVADLVVGKNIQVGWKSRLLTVIRLIKGKVSFREILALSIDGHVDVDNTYRASLAESAAVVFLLQKATQDGRYILANGKVATLEIAADFLGVAVLPIFVKNYLAASKVIGWQRGKNSHHLKGVVDKIGGEDRWTLILWALSILSDSYRWRKNTTVSEEIRKKRIVSCDAMSLLFALLTLKPGGQQPLFRADFLSNDPNKPSRTDRGPKMLVHEDGFLHPMEKKVAPFPRRPSQDGDSASTSQEDDLAPASWDDGQPSSLSASTDSVVVPVADDDDDDADADVDDDADDVGSASDDEAF